ncbi:hypothetical protein M8C21_000355, partial [Ambrosia artemisiifolia]
FLSEHPKFLRNPLYISGTSYVGIIVPKVTLELYEGAEHGDQPLNIQGYILCSPLTNKFMDFNSRLEYAHRMALISDDIYKSDIEKAMNKWANTEVVQQALKVRQKLSSKNCRALIFSGDHDFTFPYVGVEQWITSLNLHIEVPWKPFYVDDQVGGYEMKYANNNYSLTFATVKGGGHSVPLYSPKESLVLAKQWFSTHIYSSAS